MIKIIFISSFLILLIIGWQESNPAEPVNYDKDIPVWLKQIIVVMTEDQDYYGTKVYRYEWNGKFIYHIMIPISSCAYCEVYDQEGNKITFENDSAFEEFIKNRINETLIWEREK